MYREDPSGLRKELEKRFLPTGPPPQYPNYRQAEKSNEELDTDITVDELRVVVQDLRRNTAPGHGTPQESVQSLTLFNIALARLHQLLDEIPDVTHAIYADDITTLATGIPSLNPWRRGHRLYGSDLGP
ncbi:hypothetical protein HPB50_028612 [Hyalomma asiaticum]|nr:hypothetical protein HPB50_028612 [Hyalomma asiaticum]